MQLASLLPVDVWVLQHFNHVFKFLLYLVAALDVTQFLFDVFGGFHLYLVIELVLVGLFDEVLEAVVECHKVDEL